LFLDCRAVDRLSRPSDSMPLGSSSCWSDMILDDDFALHIAQSDIRDYFYACGIEESLSEYFVTIQIPFDSVSEWGCPNEWKNYVGDGMLSLALSVLPMGFSWGLHFCHCVLVRLMVIACGYCDLDEGTARGQIALEGGH